MVGLDVERVIVYGRPAMPPRPQHTQPMALWVLCQHIASNDFGGWNALAAPLSAAFRKASQLRQSCR